MATPTSSSNRSKRKGTKPITQGQNPQRSNRQKASNAQVTNSSTRGSNAGSAKVTSSSSLAASKPAPVQRRTRVNGKVKPGMVQRNQVGQPKVQRQGPSTSNVPPRATPQAPAKPSGNFKAPNISKPKPAAPKPTAASRLGNAAKKAADWVSGNTPKQQAKPASRLAKVLGGDRPAASRIGRGLVGKGSIAAMALGAANAADDARLTPAQLKKKYETVNPDRGQNLLTKFQSGTLGQSNKPKPKQGNAQSRFAGARQENLNRINNDPRFAAPAEKPKPPAPRASDSRPSQTTPSRSTASGGGGSQRSAAPQATKPAMPGQKWSDFNPGRGTSKSNNPLLDRDSGSMKLRDRMKQREASAQGEKAKNLSNNFGQDSGYQPQTKVDGSKYADKKPDMKNVNEYDRRKKRYYS